MKQLVFLGLTAALAVLSGCQQNLHDASATLAGDRSAPTIPINYPDVPDHPSTVSTRNGPFYVGLSIPDGLAPYLLLGYVGRFCPFRFSVGIVQHGALAVSGAGSIGSHGACYATLPVDQLTSGEIELFGFNSSGEYDSDSGRNYRFTLALPN